MRVLMISLDRGLFGRGYSGDVIERHKKYANLAGSLDIIVFASDKFQDQRIQENLRIFSTKSKKSSHFRSAFALAEELFKENPYDLLVTQEFASPVGKKIKQEFGLPWIVNVHGMFFSMSWLKISLPKWYLFYRIKSAMKLADGFRVNNEQIKNQLLTWGIRKPALVQPTPIDIQKFFAQGGSASGRKSQNLKPTILYVGRLAREKNVSLLIEAVKDLKHDFLLEIVGTGSEEKRLKKMADNDRRIILVGPKNAEELPDIFKAADIFVLPSNTESFGQVLLQASAAGGAIVSTKTTGAANLVTLGENGILVGIGDRDSMTRALELLLSDESLRARLGNTARERVKNLDSDSGIEKTINFWLEITKNIK